MQYALHYAPAFHRDSDVCPARRPGGDWVCVLCQSDRVQQIEPDPGWLQTAQEKHARQFLLPSLVTAKGQWLLEKSRAPDLILDGYDSPWNAKMVSPGLISSTLKEHYFIEQHGDAGWHSKEGLFVFSGSSFRPGPAARALPAAEARPAAKAWGVMDLPATLLYLYDVPIPEDFDGAVIEVAFTGDFLEQRSVTFQPGDSETAVPFETAYSQDESAEVMEHLRALGYVE
jgi:hypothetical protein